jgi:MoxR-like ATPase
MTVRSDAGPGRDRAAAAMPWAHALSVQIGRQVVGQQQLVHRLTVALLAGGHVLLEGLPGLAKTLIVKTLAQACQLSFQRLQFTPDLLPADLIGTLVYNPKTLEFAVHKGPIFANIVLADEINRAPAKVQSALLEAMQERSVTIGHESHRLDEPFLVLATQNPVEHEGTFPLPEAQLDRFLFQVRVTYPSREEELEILMRQVNAATASPRIDAVVTAQELLAARASLADVFADERVLAYVLDLVRATRDPAAFKLPAVAPLVRFGASPRAAVHFSQAARATAALAGRAYVLPADVKEVAMDVLRHRLILSYDAEADNVSADEVVGKILAAVPVP